MQPPSNTAGPRGTVTFVFTDIEGSTRLLHEAAGAYPAVLEDQRRLVRNAFERHSGHLVDTAGDGFFFVFERARDAVSAAVDAQRALGAHDWPAGATVRVRMGLHTGEPIVTGESYIGLDVHRAARIGAAAHGGQIVLSEATRQLVANDLPDGIALHDLGEHALKDFPTAQHLHQIRAPGLAEAFPPLRGVRRAVRAGLPARSLPLIGRDAELDGLRDLLRDDDVRLLTLTGAGGTGKTSLAIEVATRCISEFRDGVAYVPLAPVVDPALVFAAIAQTLAVKASAEQSMFDAVVEHLRERTLLLVLDNFEHVLGAAGPVAKLVAECAGTKVLVTSRFALRLSMEREFPVAPLRTPAAAAVETPAALRAYPAVELFARRAAALNPELRFDDDDSAVAVAEICRRLDGLPLAIELAAARIKLFSPRALLARLDRRLDLLGGGARDLPSRHRTLREAIGWSYDLLEPEEQAVFRRLAVFVGGCALDTAETVCTAAGDPGPPTLDAVAALVDKSLLRQEPGTDGEPRFSMLETVREFALEQLAAAGEEDATRDAHADAMLAIAEATEPALTGPGQTEAVARLVRDHDDMRAAFDRAVRTRDGERALRLGAALSRFWIIRGFHTEGRQRLRAALDLVSADTDEALRARVLSGAAILAYEQAALGEATEYLQQALQCHRAAGDERRIAETLNHLGWVAFFAADVERAQRLSEEAMALHEARGDVRGMALSLTNLGAVAMHSGVIPEGRDLYVRALELRHRIGDARGIAYGEINLAWSLVRLGGLERAMTLSKDAARTLRSLGDKQVLAFAYHVLGEAELERADPRTAADVLEEAVALGREVMQGASLGLAVAGLTEALARVGSYPRALELGREAIDLHVRGGTEIWLMISLCAYADALRLAGRHGEARDAYVRALGISMPGKLPFYAAESLAGLTVLFTTAGRHELATRLGAAMEAQRAHTGAAPSRRQVEAARVAAHDTGAVDGADTDLIELLRRVEREHFA